MRKKHFIPGCSFLVRLSSRGGSLCRGFRSVAGTLENEKHLSHLHSGSESSPPRLLEQNPQAFTLQSFAEKLRERAKCLV